MAWAATGSRESEDCCRGVALTGARLPDPKWLGWVWLAVVANMTGGARSSLAICKSETTMVAETGAQEWFPQLMVVLASAKDTPSMGLQTLHAGQTTALSKYLTQHSVATGCISRAGVQLAGRHNRRDPRHLVSLPGPKCPWNSRHHDLGPVSTAVLLSGSQQWRLCLVSHSSCWLLKPGVSSEGCVRPSGLPDSKKKATVMGMEKGMRAKVAH